jgi:hypothetical protein
MGLAIAEDRPETALQASMAAGFVGVDKLSTGRTDSEAASRITSSGIADCLNLLLPPNRRLIPVKGLGGGYAAVTPIRG